MCRGISYTRVALSLRKVLTLMSTLVAAQHERTVEEPIIMAACSYPIYALMIAHIIRRKCTVRSSDGSPLSY